MRTHTRRHKQTHTHTHTHSLPSLSPPSTLLNATHSRRLEEKVESVAFLISHRSGGGNIMFGESHTKYENALYKLTCIFIHMH